MIFKRYQNINSSKTKVFAPTFSLKAMSYGFFTSQCLPFIDLCEFFPFLLRSRYSAN